MELKAPCFVHIYLYTVYIYIYIFIYVCIYRTLMKFSLLSNLSVDL